VDEYTLQRLEGMGVQITPEIEQVVSRALARIRRSGGTSYLSTEALACLVAVHEERLVPTPVAPRPVPSKKKKKNTSG